MSVLFSLAREINKAVNLETDEGNAQALGCNIAKDLAQPLNILQFNPVDFYKAKVGETTGLKW